MTRIRRLGHTLAALALFGCGAPTEVHVTLDVDDALLPRERVLEVSAFDAEGTSIYRDEQLVGGDTGLVLPTGLRVVPRSGADDVRLRLVLRGSHGRGSCGGTSRSPSSTDVPTPTVPPRRGLRRLRVRRDGFSCACTTEGCAVPRCVAVGRCETDRACEEGEVQLCEHGVWAPTCEVAE
ncbi:MAG: hypothetical protein R3B99_04055 [Polyangiales bacterium]